ncbi:MAG: electron transfer flavoprotein subunit beta/FixA family protein [Saprospiraceae bacterium]|nr:electron transfer flavoprotein subunit beta/FixA family protein [Saprospiraceae bacterium]
MKFLVCISKTPDTTTKISFSEGDTKFSEDGVQFIINPYDEWYALVRALELKESLGGSVTVVNVGPAANDAVIRKALAIGADDAVRIDAEPQDAFQVAELIANYAGDQAYDMILTGKETIDYNGAMVGAIIAEKMNLPFISLASKLDMEGSTAVLEREIQGGKEVVACDLPLVVSAQKGMAEQRIPNMRGIMQARTKPLNVVAGEAAAKTSVAKYQLPAEKGAVKLIDADNPAELWDLLRNDAKVI